MQTTKLISEKSSLRFFTCSHCKEEKFSKDNFTTGYGVDREGNFVCFDCCGKEDREVLISMNAGKVTEVNLYYNEKEGFVTNWPGSLKIKVAFKNKAKHNWGLPRFNFWFYLAGSEFYGYVIGNNTEIAHVKKLKYNSLNKNS